MNDRRKTEDGGRSLFLSAGESREVVCGYCELPPTTAAACGSGCTRQRYLALTESLGCELWTADRRLCNAVDLPWVRLAEESQKPEF